MTYSSTGEITNYLPPESIDVRPLDYEWAEATNAILFGSKLDFDTFAQWEIALSEHYRNLKANDHELTVESHPDLGCMSIWFDSSPSVDVHCARCKNPDSIDNLNAWVGSALLESIAADPQTGTVGLIRIRPNI